MNEANLYVTQKGCYAYEYLYFSLDNSLPNNIELESQPNILNKFDNFHSFNSKIRKSITFINIPIQNKGDNIFDKSFLSVYLCSKSGVKLYSTFCLNSAEIVDKKLYIFNETIKKNISNIFKDYINCYEKESKFNVFTNQYFSLDLATIENLKLELFQKFHLFKYENSQKTFDYFNSLCFWNLLYVLINYKLPFKYIDDYLNVHDKLVNRNDLDYVDKSMILIDFVKRAFEDKSQFTCPKLFFYDEIDERNPYKIAFNFQFKIIENIKEESALFHPLLFLDSYIMDSIQNSSNFNFIKKLMPAYSISMLSEECIKDHLKKSIKNYFFVLEKKGANTRKYYASIQKFSHLITYNENILLYNSNYDKMYKLSKPDLIFCQKSINNYAFVLNLENLHENFAHNKELIINNKNSPTLYFDRNLNYAYIYHYETEEYGESGRLMEAFICGDPLIDEIKKNIYEMGDFLKVEYYVGKDFKSLVDGFKTIFKNYRLAEKPKLDFFNIKSSSTNCNKKNDYSVEVEEKQKLTEKNQEENVLSDSHKDSGLQNSLDNESVEKIILSKHNTFIISAETYDKLLDKIEQIKNKKIIVRKDAIEKNDDTCCY